MPLTRVHEGFSFQRTRREGSALKGNSPVIMDSPILAGINQFLYCMQATDVDDSIVPEVQWCWRHFYWLFVESSGLKLGEFVILAWKTRHFLAFHEFQKWA